MAERNKIDAFVQMTVGTLLERHHFDFQVEDAQRREAFDALKKEELLVLVGAAIGTTMAECRKFMEDKAIDRDDIIFLRRFTTLRPEVTVRYTEIETPDEDGPEAEAPPEVGPEQLAMMGEECQG